MAIDESSAKWICPLEHLHDGRVGVEGWSEVPERDLALGVRRDGSHLVGLRGGLVQHSGPSMPI